MIPLIIHDQFYTIQNLQRSPIPQTSNWSGTFFAVSYSKSALDEYVLLLNDDVRVRTRVRVEGCRGIKSGHVFSGCSMIIFHVVRTKGFS